MRRNTSTSAGVFDFHFLVSILIKMWHFPLRSIISRVVAIVRKLIFTNAHAPHAMNIHICNRLGDHHPRAVDVILRNLNVLRTVYKVYGVLYMNT